MVFGHYITEQLHKNELLKRVVLRMIKKTAFQAKMYRTGSLAVEDDATQAVVVPVPIG